MDAIGIITTILATLVALEFVYIFVLETVRTDSEATAKTFGMETEVLREPHMAVSMKNQGVYNLGIAILLLVAVFGLHSVGMTAALLAYIVFVAAYGAATVSRDIILKQGGLAILALASLLL